MQPSQIKGDDSKDAIRAVGILLGASAFPRAPTLGDAESFRHSADEVAAYMVSASGLNLSGDCVLNLFDKDLSPADQLASIRTFLEKHGVRNGTAGASDLLLYFVGHGLFASDHAYCLSIRTTDENHVGSSALRGRELADVLQGGAAFIRRHLILDCCFAASLANLFQGSPAEVLQIQLVEQYPRRGVSLLCASGTSTPAHLSSRSAYTTFTDALLKALQLGHGSFGSRMSMQDLRSLVQHILTTEAPANHSRPEIHAPHQSEGDISFFPIFPNHAFSVAVKGESLQVAQTQAVTEAYAQVDAASLVDRERKATLKLVTDTLAKYRSVNGVHLSPTLPKAELAQALALVSVPRHATVLGLCIVNIYFKLTQLGRVLDNFVLFTDTGVYLHKTWNKKVSTTFITYPDLVAKRISRDSEVYHVSRVGAYTHITLYIGSDSMEAGDFGEDDKRKMSIHDLERLLTDVQAALSLPR